MGEEETKDQRPKSEDLEQQLIETKNQLLRALADFDNFKKRSQYEREQFVQFANEGLVSEILPILDGFGRAMEHIANEEAAKGLALIKRQLEDALKKHGVAEIVALDKQYDPNYHEAIMQKEADQPAGTIIEEMQTGYTLHSRVIRPSMVIVSKGKGG
jgi:molecular chaperone GrpE